jgi:hypothetical protein
LLSFEALKVGRLKALTGWKGEECRESHDCGLMFPSVNYDDGNPLSVPSDGLSEKFQCSEYFFWFMKASSLPLPGRMIMVNLITYWVRDNYT